MSGASPAHARIPVGPCRVRAIYSWSGEDKNDLGFIEGDLIDVLNTGDGDWWTGKLRRNKMVGTFPRNFVTFVNPAQRTAPHPDVAQLAISSLANSADSAGSKNSHKSTEEILHDISIEISDALRVEKDLDTKPSELNLKASHFQGDHSFDSLNSIDDHYSRGKSRSEDSFDAELSPASSIGTLRENDTGAPPVPPPHHVLPNSAHSSFSRPLAQPEDSMPTDITHGSLMNPVATSPDLEEVPFDPKAFAPASGAADRSEISNRVTSISSTRSKSFNLGDTQYTPLEPRKSRGLVKKLFKGELAGRNGLRRSASVNSRVSTASTGSRFKKSVMSPIKSFVHAFKTGGDLYPTNDYTGGRIPLNVAKEREHTAATNALLDPKWMNSQRDLYRSKTITGHEMSLRKRAMELHGFPPVDPQNLIQDSDEYYDYNLEDFTQVDQHVLSLSNWPQLMTPAVLASSRIGRKFTDKIEQLRAVFILCTFHIAYEPSYWASDEITATSINRTMQTKRASPHTLAQIIVSMCGALDIECYAIEGQLRTPNGDSIGTTHCWNAVHLDGEWRFIDASLASPTFPGSDSDDIDTFYFLVPPPQMIYTHIPREPADQYISPPLPTAVAVTLPIASPAAFRLGARLVEYLPGMAHLNDLEDCEINVALQNPLLDIVADVVTPCGKGSTLSQPYWDNNERKFRVKAYLPEGASKGTLNIYAADRTIMARTACDMDFLYSLPLWHRGHNAPFDFVARYASPQAVRQDIYIKEPQCRRLNGGQTYSFVFDQHPSKGLTPGSGFVPVRLAVQSPSGRITKLVKKGTDVSDTWKATVRTLEVGSWRAVVSTDNSDGWTPFGEWFCN